MKSKADITQEYIKMINVRRDSLNSFQAILNGKKEEILNLSVGNRGIEEIEEELDRMSKVISDLWSITDDYESAIVQNEGRF